MLAIFMLVKSNYAKNYAGIVGRPYSRKPHCNLQQLLVSAANNFRKATAPDFYCNYRCGYLVAKTFQHISWYPGIVQALSRKI